MNWESKSCANLEEGQEVRTPSRFANHKALWFLSNTGPDRLKNHKATKPTFNVGPSSARQQNGNAGGQRVASF